MSAPTLSLRTAVGGLLAAALITACSQAPERATPVTGERPPVVVVSIDTLRSDRLPIYGYAGVATPAIDSLAGDAVVFESAYSQVPLTLPSHASAFSGLLPSAHGIRDNLGYRLADEAPYLPALLSAAGYDTGGAVSAFVLRRETGMGRGFDLYDDTIRVRHDVSAAISSRRGPETLDAIRPWLDARGDEPFFLFLHFYEPHTPYEAPEPFAARYDDGYDAEVAAADAVFGDLLESLRAGGHYDPALIVFMSDHGEGLGEHGEAEHGVLLYREALQVPLVVKLPGGARAGERVGHPVGLLDVAATIAEVVGLEAELGADGQSLLAPAQADRGIISESFYARLHYGWSELLSVIRGTDHYIAGPAPELYDLEADPAELEDVLRRRRRTGSELAAVLDAYDSSLAPPAEVDPETERRLASLGYLTRVVETPDDGEPLPDPKAQLHTLTDLWQARAAQQEGRFEEALASVETVLAANPRMVDAWELQGNALEALGRPEEALAAYQRALEIAGPSGYLMLAAARAQLELGRVEEALEGARYARRAGAVDPAAFRDMALHLSEHGRTAEAMELLVDERHSPDPDMRTTWARLLSEAGRQGEAEAVLRGVLASDPDHARAHETAGLVALRMERYEEAVRASRRATELDAGLADAWNNLGAAFYLLDRKTEAVAAWEEAVAQDPEQYETLFNLGVKAPEVGDFELAIWALRRFVETAPADRYADDLRETRRLLARLGG